MDVAAIRKDFPLLARTVNGKPIVYLDNAATSQKPQCVIDALCQFYQASNANVHRGIYALSEEATLLYETSREKVARFIGAPSPRSTVYTRNTTEAINLVSHAWGRLNLKAGDEVLITEMEHHSNIVPWLLLCQETGATLRSLPVTEDGLLDLSELDSLLTERTRLFAVTQMSNVLGTINPVRELVAKAHAVGALALVDGAQSVPHLEVDVKEMGCDFFAFSAHKMLGPTGIGVLYAREELLEKMGPFLGGGEMISEVYLDHATWKDIPWKYEAGTPNFADAVAFGVAIDYLEKIGMKAVRQHEKELTAYALRVLENVGGVKVFGPPDAVRRGGVVSFWMEGVHPHDLAQVLDTEGVCIRAGHHCAQPLMRRLRVPATARASFYLYNTRDEIDVLVGGLKKATELFGHVPG
ncbi:MAG: cysteine desulfurase [Chloroflexi bacterium]|nr:cysteine desulfurase [Chloroflexota bacterium]